MYTLYFFIRIAQDKIQGMW